MSRLFSAFIFVILALVSEEANPGQGCPPSDRFDPCKCGDLSINCDKAGSTDALAEAFNLDFRDFGVFKAVIMNNSAVPSLPSGIFNSIRSKLFYIAHCDKLSVIGENAFEGSEGTLETLILTNNAIERESVFNAASKLRNLKRLHLFRNKITAVPDNALNSLEKLETINLQNNEISKIGKQAFFNLTSLRYLRLQNNRVTTIDDLAFSFGASNHPFTTDVMLQDNDIVELRPDSLKGIDRKLTLNLKNNHLTTLPENVFQPILNFFFSTEDRTSSIKVEGNDFTCDCKLKWMKERENVFAYVPLLKCSETDDYLALSKTPFPEECRY